MARLFTLIMLAWLVGCAGKQGDTRKLDAALYSYAGTIRWGDLAGAMAFVDPELREKLQPSPLQMRRMEQLQVTGYYVQAKTPVSASELHQVVEIRFANKHNLVERAVIDRQIWRWDEEEKAWWLTSALPDFAPK